MKRLTAKEEEVMGWFWEKGPLFVRELLSFYDEPKPHFNNSYRGVVSMLVQEEKISVEELKELIKQVEESERH